MEPIKRTSGLGRGLAALMGDLAPANAAQPVRDDGVPVTALGTATMMLPVADLRPNSRQPRRSFDDAAMADLVESVKSRGIIQPLLVRRRPFAGDWEIVAGERRWRAAQAAQLHEVPVVIVKLDDTAAYEVAIIENVQRADLNPIEEADAYRKLATDHGRTQEEIATAVGKSRSHIANLLRLTQLSDGARALVAEGKLSLGHAKVLLGAPADAQDALAERVAGSNLSVRQTEALLAGKPGAAPRPAAVPPAPAAVDPDIAALATLLCEATGLEVDVVASGPASGTVQFGYSSLDQLDGLIARLTRR